MKKTLFVVTFVISIMLFSFVLLYPDKSLASCTVGMGVIFGSVEDENGNGIEDVTIRTSCGGGSWSEVDGLISFPTSPGTSMRVTVSHPYYMTRSKYIDLLNGGTSYVDFKMIATIDPDNDNIPSDLDNCPGTCNRQQKDADHDGDGDVCDDTPGCGGCGTTACETEC